MEFTYDQLAEYIINLRNSVDVCINERALVTDKHNYVLVWKSEILSRVINLTCKEFITDAYFHVYDLKDLKEVLTAIRMIDNFIEINFEEVTISKSKLSVSRAMYEPKIPDILTTPIDLSDVKKTLDEMAKRIGDLSGVSRDAFDAMITGRFSCGGEKSKKK